MPVQRADARRNYERILAEAEREVAAHGADASLEQIARTVGVGSATVRRHFPGRRALLEAVFRERIEALCARARELAGAPDPRAALLEALHGLAAYATSARGLATALTQDGGAGPEHVNACPAKISDAYDPLLERAARAGAVASDVTTADLVTLISGIALATEHDPDAAARTDRLLRLAVAGISPSG
ncbi:TetR/AcrR family transcriptional regulator [Streptomyces liangshanensis]|uniref:TetR/AcrR family transcriptional regulator n=1 Tax=Streptomyces liangshanensis TaxID=2717324 RepID=A0A6G9GVL3_9ACTN|nr:TetR/AcrR family transcriptional regulator [Streptomyces liangshanensis]QIQ01967.1 TetR/AcrR family transcriptional regulator [Streptomyces liangshanensis]